MVGHLNLEVVEARPRTCARSSREDCLRQGGQSEPPGPSWLAAGAGLRGTEPLNIEAGKQEEKRDHTGCFHLGGGTDIVQ